MSDPTNVRKEIVDELLQITSDGDKDIKALSKSIEEAMEHIQRQQFLLNRQYFLLNRKVLESKLVAGKEIELVVSSDNKMMTPEALRQRMEKLYKEFAETNREVAQLRIKLTQLNGVINDKELTAEAKKAREQNLANLGSQNAKLKSLEKRLLELTMFQTSTVPKGLDSQTVSKIISDTLEQTYRINQQCREDAKAANQAANETIQMLPKIPRVGGSQ